MTTVNWIICSNKGILAKFGTQLLFFEVAGDSPLQQPHFNTIKFRSKHLKLRIISREKPAWLRGFSVRSLGGGVRMVLRSSFIHWICNIFLVTSLNWIMYRIETEGFGPNLVVICCFWESPEIHISDDRISTQLTFVQNA